MTSEAQKKAVAKYDAINTKSMSLKFNLKSDADILEALEANAEKYGGKQSYIKYLMRKALSE